ncbi:hypothetical protein HDE_00555 [Halotydeus destructor]|nr:hypothetical protein HDE_00555 [Halotydeus destructor]
MDSMVKGYYWLALSRYSTRTLTYVACPSTEALVDMRLSRKVSSMKTTCFPGMVDHLYICGLPLTLTAVIQTMVKMSPSGHASEIHFITVEQAKAGVACLTPIAEPEGSNIREILLKHNLTETRLNCAKTMSDKFFDQLGSNKGPLES